MAFGVAAMDLAGDDPDKRLAAIDLLAGSLDPPGARAARPGGRRSRRAGRGQGGRRRRRSPPSSATGGSSSWSANLYQGISLGSILLLAAIGLAITFGVMGVINMAHGEMIMLGAYSAFVVQELFRA